jgi:adenylosuccinate synthase
VGIERLRVAYVTRAYTTRHGAGPLEGARDLSETFDIVDATNVPNPWQGGLRYGPLDLGRLARAIDADRALCKGGLALDRRLVVTCLDQARGPVPTRREGEEIALVADEVATHAARELGLPLLAQGWGATRAGVRFHDNLAAAA